MTDWGTNRENVARAQTELQSAMEREWRDWKAFIEEKLATLAEERQGGSQDDLLKRRKTDKRSQSSISGERRKMFDMILEQRRQAIVEAETDAARREGRTPKDVSALYLQTLRRIDLELKGEIDPDGYAIFPFQGQMYRYNFRRFATQTSDAEWQLANRGAKTSSRAFYTIAGGVTLVAVLFLCSFWIFGRSAPLIVTPSDPVALVNGAEIPFWDIQNVQLDDVVGSATIIRDRLPHVVCLPLEWQSRVRANSTLTLTGTTSVQVLRLVPLAEPMIDLHIAMCRADGTSVLMGAVIIDTPFVMSLPPNIVVNVVSWNAAIDPVNIPASRMVVDVSIMPSPLTQGQDPRLFALDAPLVPIIPVSRRMGANEIIYRYSLPVVSAPQIFGIGYETTPIPMRGTLMIPSPLPRTVWLENVLVDDGIAMLRFEDGLGTRVIRGEITMKASQVVTLSASDVVVTQDGNAGNFVVTMQQAPMVFEPNQPQLVVFTVDIGSVSPPVEIAIGRWRTRIVWDS